MFDTKSTQRLGNDGFVWFYGVVEDIEDPLQLGRMRVRVLGDHTQSKKNIPTEDLPWAYIINDIRSSSMQGIGNSPTGLYCLGAWVFGFYGDGIDKQQPVIQGTIMGIPESIPWKSEKVGFQDPDEIFPMGHHIFEQDTNRLARNKIKDHAIEVPEGLVPPQEKMIEDGLCPKQPVYGKNYYDTFDEKYVRKFAHGENLHPQESNDDKCQFFLETNNHPFTVYKFINRERFIPMAKVFADPMHREYWHEPDNPWDSKYPYNKVWEGYHEVGTSEVHNPSNKFVSEAYAYDKSIENYDGSDKEGIHRKQICGIGSWGLGEEWDSTEGAQRYHRFHPSANYFEIDNDGNETRKIYGDSFEIDLKDRTILIKGDWNVTVEGNKNELIEGDYNLQIMGDKNTDVRGNIKTHADGNNEWHFKGNNRKRVDGDERIRVAGSRNTSILVDDYVESQKTEMRADEIIRKGGKSMIDEAFVMYELKAHEMEMSVCKLDSQIETWNNVNETVTNDIISLTERVITHNYDVDLLTEEVAVYDLKVDIFNETIVSHSEYVGTYEGCVDTYTINTVDYELYYQGILLFEKGGTAGGCVFQGGGIAVPTPPTIVDVGTANYPETDGISQCLKEYNKCITEAKAACETTLKDPRTLEDYTRFDWEKYHASIDSCKRSYEMCVEANKGAECGVCSPEPGILEFPCMPCHDPRCPSEDKEYEFYKCPCECHEPEEEKIKDPWLDCEQEKP